MAIQMRRGANSDFSPSKMLPGEIAVTTDGTRKVYAAFKNDDVKELASKEDVQGLINGFTSVVDREIAEAEQRIESKGQQVLETIPDLYEEVSARADEAVRTKADAIVCSVTGVNPIAKDSSNDYLRNLKLYGKTTQGENPSPQYPQPLESKGKWGNLLENKADSKSVSGIDYVVSKDKTVSAVGTATAYAFLDLNDDIKLENGEYVLSGGHPDFTLQVFTTKIDGTVEYIAYNYGGNTEFIVDNTNVTKIGCRLYPENNIYVNTVLKPQITRKEDNITSYRPYSEQKEIESGVYGKNLWSLDSTISATTQGSPIHLEEFVLPVGSYKWSFNADTNDYTVQLNIRRADNSAITSVNVPVITNGKKEVEFELTEESVSVSVFFNNAGTISDFMVRKAEITDDTYVPYSKQSHTSLVADGLKGIPVTDASLATYTDENGVMWCSDYVDCERGVLVQRIYSHVYDGTEDIRIEYNNSFYDNELRGLLPPVKSSDKALMYCSHLQSVNSIENQGFNNCYVSLSGRFNFDIMSLEHTVDAFKQFVINEKAKGTPFTVSAILKEPIETPLSASEIESYKALKSNYKVTSVMNDCGAFMEVQYNADTKTYIDNKFAALAAQLV